MDFLEVNALGHKNEVDAVALGLNVDSGLGIFDAFIASNDTSQWGLCTKFLALFTQILLWSLWSITRDSCIFFQLLSIDPKKKGIKLQKLK